MTDLLPGATRTASGVSRRAIAAARLLVGGVLLCGGCLPAASQRADHDAGMTPPTAVAQGPASSSQGQSARQGQRLAAGGRTSPVAPIPEGDDELLELLKEGATMEDVAKRREPVAKTPDEAVSALRVGNARFFGGTARRPELSALERRAQILSQSPFAIILGCADSRVPTEIVFDQGLGSLFVVRVAGNVTEPVTMGSVEYAIKHLKSKVLVVMGHEGCGAVAAAMLKQADVADEPENVKYLLDLIRPAVSSMPQIRDSKARMREAANNNIRLQVARAKQNPVVAEAVKDGRLKVIGAYYEMGSGAVDLLERPEELLVDVPQRRPADGPGTVPGH